MRFGADHPWSRQKPLSRGSWGSEKPAHHKGNGDDCQNDAFVLCLGRNRTESYTLATMIDFHTWSTPNGRKVAIMLEECSLPYRVFPVNLDAGAQHAQEFRAINPNGRIPAIVDQEGPDGLPFALWESGAILIYLADKTSRFIPEAPRERYATLQWLMFQMSAVGPAYGQLHHFLHSAPAPVHHATERFRREKDRVYRVLDDRLGKSDFLAGAVYTIADIATYPWVARHERHQTDLNHFANVKRWFDHVGARPGVQRGMQVPQVP